MPPETQSAGRQVFTLGLTGVDTLLARAQASRFATRIPWSAFPFPCCCFKMTKKAGAAPDTVPPSRLVKTICCFSMMSTFTSSQTKCKFYRVLIIFYVCSPFWKKWKPKFKLFQYSLSNLVTWDIPFATALHIINLKNKQYYKTEHNQGVTNQSCIYVYNFDLIDTWGLWHL